MSEPLEISELLNEELFDGETFDEKAEEFDYEYSVRLAADTLRMALGMKDANAVRQQIGALGALGIELEDLKFASPGDMNYIAGLLMS